MSMRTRIARPSFAALVAIVCMADSASAQQPATVRDGVRDFDWEIGAWQTHVRVLAAPLTGSDEWVEFDGTTVVTAASAGRANLAELDIAGPGGRIEGLSLRLYEPASGQWSINWVNARNGLLTAPVTGAFRDGRGEFYGEDRIGGRMVLVRFVIDDVTDDSARFEQAYSVDGGRTWEVNWIATDRRIVD